MTKTRIHPEMIIVAVVKIPSRANGLVYELGRRVQTLQTAYSSNNYSLTTAVLTCVAGQASRLVRENLRVRLD